MWEFAIIKGSLPKVLYILHIKMVNMVEQVFYQILKTFAFKCPYLIFGNNTIERLGVEVKKYGKKILLVTDKGLIKAGLADKKVIPSLDKEDLDVDVFDEVETEPSVGCVGKVSEKVRNKSYDAVIGLGGGSSLDMAKTASFIAKTPGSVTDYMGKDKVKTKGLPLILVPTTAGTGSEVSPYIVLSTAEAKKSIVSPLVMADVSIVDPLLTLSLPPKLTAGTGLDALSHAIEGMMSLKSSKLSDALALEAIRLVGKYVERAYLNGDDIEARYHMSLAATLAGLVLGTAGVNLGHSIAHTISMRKHLHHGFTCGMTLPYAMMYNISVCRDKFIAIAEALGEKVEGLSPIEASEKAVNSVIELNRRLNIPLSLKEIGIAEEILPELADELVQKYPRPNNPRKFEKEALLKLYELMYEGI